MLGGGVAVRPGGLRGEAVRVGQQRGVQQRDLPQRQVLGPPGAPQQQIGRQRLRRLRGREDGEGSFPTRPEWRIQARARSAPTVVGISMIAW